MDLDGLVHFDRFIRLTSVNPDENRRRFYMLTWDVSLFGEPVLVRTYGRLGTPGRTVARLYANEEIAWKEVQKLIKLRIRHGYQVTEQE